MPALYILIGPAGVGKTSLVNRISAGNVVSTDAIRIERYGSLTEGNKHNPQVFKAAYSYIHTLLDMGQDVFFDATNIRRLLRADLYQDVKKRHPNVPVIALIIISLSLRFSPRTLYVWGTLGYLKKLSATCTYIWIFRASE